jgi:hypothetical protein
MMVEKSCTVQDVFDRFYPAYEKAHILPAHNRKAAFHIMNCKTGAFGVNISVCEDVSVFTIIHAEAAASHVPGVSKRKVD